VQEFPGADAAQWRDEALRRLARVRAAGYRCPLFFTSNGAGRNADTVLAEGAAIVEADPLRNTICKVQAYWGRREDYTERIPALAALPFPVEIGTGTEVAAPWTDPVVQYRLSAELCHQHDMPWMAWAWYHQFQKPRSNMTTDGVYGHWQPSFGHWGRWLCDESPYGLHATVVHRPLRGEVPADWRTLPSPPEALGAEALTDRAVRLTWSHNLAHAHGFIIERRPAGASDWTHRHKVGRVTEFAEGARQGLEADTAYVYRVRAYSLDAGESAPCAEAAVRTAVAPPAGPGTGLLARYWKGHEHAGRPVVERVEPMLDVSWSGVSAPNVPLAWDDLSARWTGTIVPRYTEEYSFFLHLCGTGTLRVAGRELMAAQCPHTMPYLCDTVELEAGRAYPVELTFSATGQSSATARLQWWSRSQPREVVPAERLFPDTN